MSSVEERLQALEDREAVYRLVASYSLAVDGGNLEALSEVVTDDYVGEMSEATYTSLESLRSTLRGEQYQAVSEAGMAHMWTMPYVVVDGDHAAATFHSAVFRRRDGEIVAFKLSGNRIDCVRTAHGWRITHRLSKPLDGSRVAPELLSRFFERPEAR
jgi:hypothetical protein